MRREDEDFSKRNYNLAVRRETETAIHIPGCI